MSEHRGRLFPSQAIPLVLEPCVLCCKKWNMQFHFRVVVFLSLGSGDLYTELALSFSWNVVTVLHRNSLTGQIWWSSHLRQHVPGGSSKLLENCPVSSCLQVLSCCWYWRKNELPVLLASVHHLEGQACVLVRACVWIGWRGREANFTSGKKRHQQMFPPPVA